MTSPCNAHRTLRGGFVFGELTGWLPGCSRTRALVCGAQSSSNSHDSVRISSGEWELFDNGVPALWRPRAAPVGRHARGCGYRSRTARSRRRASNWRRAERGNALRSWTRPERHGSMPQSKWKHTPAATPAQTSRIWSRPVTVGISSALTTASAMRSSRWSR